MNLYVLNTKVLNTVAIRATRISDKEHLKEELYHLTKVFNNIGYKDRDIKKAIDRKDKRNRA
jgi:hypothetical protein